MTAFRPYFPWLRYFWEDTKTPDSEAINWWTWDSNEAIFSRSIFHKDHSPQIIFVLSKIHTFEGGFLQDALMMCKIFHHHLMHISLVLQPQYVQCTLELFLQFSGFTLLSSSISSCGNSTSSLVLISFRQSGQRATSYPKAQTKSTGKRWLY